MLAFEKVKREDWRVAVVSDQRSRRKCPAARLVREDTSGLPCAHAPCTGCASLLLAACPTRENPENVVQGLLRSGAALQRHLQLAQVRRDVVTGRPRLHRAVDEQ